MFNSLIQGAGGGGGLANASGALTSGTLGDGVVFSGNIASGQVGNPHFASGSTIDSSEWMIDNDFTAGEIISGATIACAVALTQSGTMQTAMASVSGRMPAVGVVIANVASGATVTMYRGGRVFSPAFSFSGWMNQPIYIGRSGQLIASGAPTNSGDVQQIMGVSISLSGMMVQVGDALEGAIAGSGDIGSGSVTGQAGGGYFDIASGTLGTYDLASGATVPRSLCTAPIYSGTFSTLVTEENVSGVRAVAISQSGRLRVAMAAVSGRMPAVGVVMDNVLSGIQANVYIVGVFQNASGLADYSGFLGGALWVGRSGQITTLSGSWSSGGFASGDIGQKAAIVVNSGGMFLNLNLIAYSGGPLGMNTGGIV